MPDSRLKPLHQVQVAKARRDEQHRLFDRNQATGLLLIALAVLIFRLLRTRSGGIFPAGWWRLW